ncbi:glutamate ABC transporter substrate-binding protein [Actinacidiphila soli]|uniref:glutamate ABC transporter substrate-binding protein n=1 Tax=Actinacidiphila soli TaxID=2487275 RepID=UPI000FCAA7F6|nr:glutamate ABC transporter substrate-binding protein [Actinacidiphila soli]
MLLSGRRKLRGWGGVAGMAAACMLAVSATALPLHDQADTAAGRDTPLRTQNKQVSATDTSCGQHPEASLTPSTASGPAVDRIKKAGKLVVGVDQNSYRWGYRDAASGDIVGFDIDLVKAIAKDILGDENAVQYKTVPTSKRFEAIRKHQVDMVVRTVTINCQRITEEKVAFSTAYFQAGQQLLVPRQGSTIKDFNNTLNGKKVCTAKTSTGQAKLEEQPHGSHIVLVDNQLDCLVLLQLGEVDAVFTDNALAAGQAAQDPAVHLVGKPATTEYYGVAMNSGDTDLVRRVNQVLENYRSGGTGSQWEQAYRTWLKAVLPGIDGPPAPLYKNG